jgi:hypothetical protein
MMLSACRASVIMPTVITGMPTVLLDLLSEGNLIARADRNARIRIVAARRNVDEIAA